MVAGGNRLSPTESADETGMAEQGTATNSKQYLAAIQPDYFNFCTVKNNFKNKCFCYNKNKFNNLSEQYIKK